LVGAILLGLAALLAAATVFSAVMLTGAGIGLFIFLGLGGLFLVCS